MNYELAKQLSQSENVEERCQVAAARTTAPEILYYLVDDRSDAVRTRVAENPATPPQADLRLTADGSEDVRAALAARIAALVPGLPAAALTKAQELTLEVLRRLAQDEAVRVRAVLSEALRDLSGAPHDVILQLARDVELRVAEPVLRHSPILTDDDLLDILNSGPVAGALAAVAGRRSVSENLSAAIAASADSTAIAALLGNPSAQIREDTLDRLLEQAPQKPDWHEPLARRPRLSAGAIRRLAQFVAGHLLDVLSARPEIDAETAAGIAELVRQRMTETPEAEDRPADRARRLHSAGLLDEAAVTAALESGERAFVSAALALLAGTDSATVSRILSSASAKGVTALAWKAGLSMRLALQLQTRLAGIAPQQALYPRDGSAYPLREDDLRWQLEFFGIAT